MVAIVTMEIYADENLMEQIEPYIMISVEIP